MFVQTRSSLLKNQCGECETVVFKTERNNEKLVKQNKIITATKESNKKEEKNLDMKKLRYEVIKFGSSGFDGSKKEESRIALAVALGAKPPKKKCRNYVEILAEKKAEKEKACKLNKNNADKFSSGVGTSIKLRRRKGKGNVGLLSSYGKIRPDKKFEI